MYFETKTNIYELENNLFFPKINKKENLGYEKPITESEWLKAVPKLSNIKSSGLDSFAIEFYKAFWQGLQEIFQKMSQLLFKSNSAE